MYQRVSQRLANAPILPPREADRRTGNRIAVCRAARLRIGDLVLIGEVHDVGRGGVFFRTEILAEVGERGVLVLDRTPFDEGVPVRVAWTRPGSHSCGAGLGVAFDLRDRSAEQRALELLLALVGR